VVNTGGERVVSIDGGDLVADRLLVVMILSHCSPIDRTGLEVVQERVDFNLGGFCGLLLAEVYRQEIGASGIEFLLLDFGHVASEPDGLAGFARRR
jgi:hypothetical protein